MKISRARYIERTRQVTENIRSAAWGIRGIGRALTKYDLDCEIEDAGRLSGQDICDLHCAVLSLSQHIDENLQWFDTTQIEGGKS